MGTPDLRISEHLDGQFIPDARYSLYADCPTFELLAETSDVDVDGSCLSVEIEAPCQLKELLTGEYSPRLSGQSEQQIKFLRTQLNAPLA
jgi:hypothetical protein